MVNSETEIRKLSIGELNSLARSLSPDAWKILMASIKIPGSTSIPRFTSEEVRLIEEAGNNQHRPAAEVFLSEWCTMGKTKPTVGSMLQLLIEANLQRAADYLAVDILKGDPPERPRDGPAAPVDVSKFLEELNSPELDHEVDMKRAEFWDESTVEMNLGGQSHTGVIEMRFSGPKMYNLQASPAKNLQGVTTDLIKFSESVDQGQEQKSDLIKFSSDIIDDEKLKGNDNNAPESKNLLPSFSLLGINSGQKSDSTFSSFYTETTSSVDSSEGSTTTRTDSMQSDNLNMPAMSQLLPDHFKPESDENKIDQQEIDPSVSSGNIRDVPVTVLEFFKR